MAAKSSADSPDPSDKDSSWRLGGWLDGPNLAAPVGEYPGERLGLNAHGPGSLATLGPRVVALVIDWVAALAIARLIDPTSQMLPLVILFLEHLMLVSTSGTSLGHRFMKMRVVPLENASAPPGFLAGVVRSCLLILVIPAVIWDADNRGLHDKAAGTALVRSV